MAAPAPELAQRVADSYAGLGAPDPAPLRTAYDRYPAIRRLFASSPYNTADDIETGRVTACLLNKVIGHLRGTD